MAQLPLGIALDDYALFETFYAAGNELAVQALQNLTSPGIWIWGPPGCGKSHLLQAVAVSNDALYMPLASVESPLALDGLHDQRVLVLDDVDAVSGTAEWESAIFRLYNDIAGHGGILVASAAAPPRREAVELADLHSRYSALVAFRINALDDDNRAAALGMRAAHRGLNLSERSIQYLIHHTDRDMRSLYDLLHQLDRESLIASRRITIPFIKAYLDGAPAE